MNPPTRADTDLASSTLVSANAEKSFTDKPLDKHPFLEKINLWYGIIGGGLAATAGFLGHADSIRTALPSLLDGEYVFYIHYAVAILVVSIISLTILSVWVWVTRIYLSHLHRFRRISTIAVAILLFGCGIWVIRIVIPTPPPVFGSVDKWTGDWTKEIMSAKAKEQETGESGVASNLQYLDDGPQVWATSQSITAFLLRQERLLPDDYKKIGDFFGYIEKERLDRNDKNLQTGVNAVGANLSCGSRTASHNGWAYTHDLDWGATEVIGWVSIAYAFALRDTNIAKRIWPDQNGVDEAKKRLQQNLTLLISRQLPDGGWSPVGGTSEARNERTYSTAMALWAIIEAKRADLIYPDTGSDFDESADKGIHWLLNVYRDRIGNDKFGWVPNPRRDGNDENFDGLTAQVLFVLTRAQANFSSSLNGDDRFAEDREKFLAYGAGLGVAKEAPLFRSTSPDSNMRMHDSDKYLRGLPQTVEASTFLWFPWSLALCAETISSTGPESKLRAIAETSCELLIDRTSSVKKAAESQPFSYVKAEDLFGLNWYFRQVPRELQRHYNYFRDISRLIYSEIYEGWKGNN